MESLTRILLVEDSPADARVIRELLRETGAPFQLTHVVRLQDAICSLRQSEIDVILLDLSLPDTHGIETVRQMRVAAPATALAVLTGHADERIALEALREGVEDYITKGHMDGRMLLRAIRYAMERRRAANALAAVQVEREHLLASERAARTEAERVNRLHEEFLSTVSHELRTPMNAILGWTQILQRGPIPDEKIRRALTIIDRNARLQAALIDDLLDVTRTASGKLRLHPEIVDVSDVITAAVESIRPEAGAKNITLEQQFHDANAHVRGDAKRLQQICWNILSNAIKFTPRGGVIRVALERTTTAVRVTVADTGEGIAPEFLPFVFDRFRQGDGSSTRKHPGLGLGLSIVKQLVHLHGGRVWVRSAGIGQGATFAFEIPSVATEPHQALLAHRAPALTVDGAFDCDSLAGTKVLVIDDDPNAVEVVQHLVTECRGEAITAPSAASGFERLTREAPDVVICDISMPDEDGYAFIRRVRQLPPEDGGDTPAIALTALGRTEDRHRSLQAGYQRHLSKPVDADELVNTVSYLAAGRRQGNAP